MKEKKILKITENGFLLGDEPFYLASGDIHYFRILRESWKKRLELMKDFGLTAVQIYSPWNLHEAEEGKFCFEGNLDLAYFFTLCTELDLKVMFRPSPYICSEMDFGGLPYWLIGKNVNIRTSDETFMKYVKRYYDRIAKEFIPFLSTNGGPIIAVAVENEYGSFADDKKYLKELGDYLINLGVDVPLYTANGFEPSKLLNGTITEYFTTLDLHELTDEAKSNLLNFQPNKPIFISEYWSGRSQQWENFFCRQSPEKVAENYRNMLNKGAYINFYMFCGGTNFGFTNGALVGRAGADVKGAKNRFIPFATSYDVDALVSENGMPTEKYFKCKEVLKNYLESRNIEFKGNSKKAEDYTFEFQKIEGINLTEYADLLNNAENLATKKVNSGFPLTMADLEQDFGFVLYKTFVEYTDDNPRAVTIDGLEDRATIYADGKYIGTYMRDKENKPAIFNVAREGTTLEILVENMGRVNFGLAMLKNKKGISGYVKLDTIMEDGSLYIWDYSVKTNWENYSLKFCDLSKTDYSKAPIKNRPVIAIGEFKAKLGVPTFFDPEGLTKGFVFINGFNIGRYWNVGPQRTLFVPGELIKENNKIEIVELHNLNENMTVNFTDKPMLDSLNNTKDLQESVVG